MKNKEDILAKWLSGQVNDAELEAIEGADALRELKQVINEVDQWSMPKYDTDAGFQKMKNNIGDKPQKNKRVKWIRVIAILGFIGLSLFALMTIFGNKDKTLEAKNGRNLNFAFEDNSEVWLNDGSKIRYNENDWSTERTIELQGEALFEVSKGVPFIVNTPNGMITVLGTQFNVRAWGDNLYVECYEGRVRVQSENQSTILTASEEVSIINGSMNANQNINNTFPTWQNGISRFYNDQLKVVCKELERQYAITVELKSSDRIFSGSFRHDDLNSALRSICKPLDLRYTVSQDKKSVVIE